MMKFSPRDQLLDFFFFDWLNGGADHEHSCFTFWSLMYIHWSSYMYNVQTHLDGTSCLSICLNSCMPFHKNIIIHS